MADLIYNSFLFNSYDADAENIDLAGDTIKVALLANTYTPDRDAHDNWDDISGHEVSGTGCTAGGATLAGKAYTQDNTNDLAKFDANDVSWPSSTITARYGVIYKDTGTPSTSKLIALIDFGGDQSTSNTEFKITWNASGILQVQQG